MVGCGEGRESSNPPPGEKKESGSGKKGAAFRFLSGGEAERMVMGKRVNSSFWAGARTGKRRKDPGLRKEGGGLGQGEKRTGHVGFLPPDGNRKGRE